MEVIFESSGKSKKIKLQIALYSELFETFIQENDFFETPTNEKLQIAITEEQIQKFEEFFKIVIEHKKAEKIKRFKPNADFSRFYFEGKSDEEILDYYLVSDYLQARLLHESLNYYLGSLFDLPRGELEAEYAVEGLNYDAEYERVEKDCVARYDKVLLKALYGWITGFSGYVLSFKNKYLFE